MTELGPETGIETGLWAVRIVGSLAGSVISLIYLMPRGRREAAGRLATGMTSGLIFGGPTGLWLAAKLQLAHTMAASEIMLAGSAVASLCAWWTLGVLARLADRWGGRR